MDLVEVVLRAVNAERYLNTFKQYNISPDCLKLLSEQDLEVMGIEDTELQKRIIEHCKALLINIPEKNPVIIDTAYVKDVLENIDKQLYFQYNNLVLSAYREDIIVYNIKLGEASNALRRCVKDLSKDTKYLNEKVALTKKRNKIKAVFLSMVSVGFILGILIKVLNK